ncbi:NAD(P)-dependent alcohol dehydrogenase [Falsiroseomonas sp.]|uniref:NAD(P)-dependent alcohol dehydrogenase n=1 Tax=Falsiroseomonas sp. TaxID=2870721 RepID=UPI003F6F4C12
MRAVTCRRYGPPDVLRIEDLPRPVPAARELRVRVAATTVTSGDARIRGFRCPAIFWLPMRLVLGLRGPRRPVTGMEFAGVVDAVGDAVTRFSPGDRVFGLAAAGAHAEWLVVAEDSAVAPAPAGLSDFEAAALPFGGLSALIFLRDVAKVKQGERVLVIGAAGAVGASAVQLARHLGAEVAAVCGAGNINLVRSLGATVAHDRAAWDSGQEEGRYDVILDAAGAAGPASVRRALAPRGRHVLLSFGVAGMAWMMLTALWPGRRVICGFAGGGAADLRFLRDLAEAGTLLPVIDRVLPLEAVVEAHRHVDSGRKRGALVLTVGAGRPA